MKVIDNVTPDERKTLVELTDSDIAQIEYALAYDDRRGSTELWNQINALRENLGIAEIPDEDYS